MKRILSKQNWLVLFIAISFLVGPTTSMADTILFEDNFDAEHGGIADGSTLNYNSFAKWEVTDGTVDLICNGYYDFHPGNGLYVDLDGSSSNAGILTTKAIFNFHQNVQYALEFYLGRSQPYGETNDVTVQVSFATMSWFITNSDPLKLYTVYFTDYLGSNTTPLTFFNAGGDNIGAVLDRVKLSQVPEPTTILFLGIGLIGLAGVGRKFKK